MDAEMMTAEFLGWKAQNVIWKCSWTKNYPCRSTSIFSVVMLYKKCQIRVTQTNLSFDASMNTVVHSFILTRLDFCNALLTDLPKFWILQFQSNLNCATNLTHTALGLRQGEDHRSRFSSWYGLR